MSRRLCPSVRLGTISSKKLFLFGIFVEPTLNVVLFSGDEPFARGKTSHLPDHSEPRAIDKIVFNFHFKHTPPLGILQQ